MPTQRVSEGVIRNTMRIIASLLATGEYYIGEKTRPKQKSAVMAAAEQLGIGHAAVLGHLAAGATRFRWTPEDFLTGGSEIPDEGDIPDGLSVINRVAPLTERHIASAKRKWRRIIPVRPEPFGIAFVGDPHLDNKGCNLSKLRSDMEIIRASRLRAVQMGDVLDNFHARGKLAEKQADNFMTRKEGLGAARWLARDCGFDWDAFILGNHDKWLGPQGELLFSEWLNPNRVFDWMAELTYVWEGGQFCVLAAHDFKGHSIHNPLHGNFRRAMEDGTADLYVSAHRHNAAKGGFENGHRGKHYHHLRVKGYKEADGYAKRGGFAEQSEGHSGVAVIDPLSGTQDGICRLFYDLADGAEYLQMLRSR